MVLLSAIHEDFLRNNQWRIVQLDHINDAYRKNINNTNDTDGPVNCLCDKFVKLKARRWQNRKFLSIDGIRNLFVESSNAL